MPAGERWHYTYEGSPYYDIRLAVRIVKPGASDVVIDGGSGFGKVPTYVALATSATCIGIEAVEHRVKSADRVRAKFNIPNLSYVHGDILDQDLSQGNIFYFFNPFSDRVKYEVREKLQTVAQTKPITIIANYMYGVFDNQPWLRSIPVRDKMGSIGVYVSR